MAFAIGKFHTTVAHDVNRNSCVSQVAQIGTSSQLKCVISEILSLQITYTQHRKLTVMAKYLNINIMLISIAK